MQRILNRRRSWLAAMALGVSAIVAPTVAPTPAGAANAPLVTEDGIGIRVDEWAIQGPALEAIETALQPTVDTLVQDGAVDAELMDDPDYVISTSNLELAFDILAPTTTRPYGSLNFSASIQDIWIEYYRYGEIWQPECWITVYPDNSSISVDAVLDPTNLPASPIEVQPASATWDDDPNVTVNNFFCNGYLIDEWWEGFVDSFSGGDPTSTASQVEDQIDAMSQDLVDQIWEENVTPVLDSLNDFGITVGQLRTDAYGLIVTGDVDATTGVDLPGYTEVDVTNAQDSGANSDVNALLAEYEEIIVSVHPNVVNQLTFALNSSLVNLWGTMSINGPAAEALLIPLANQGSYNDATWVARLNTSGGTNSPLVIPDPTTGAPRLNLPAMNVQFRNGFTLVATFTGNMTNNTLVTEVRTGTTEWGPAFRPTGSSLSVTRTQANTHASQVAAQTSAQILPYAQGLINFFTDTFLTNFISLAPIELYDLNVDLCTTCGRYSGDERYTETFHVN